MQVAYPNVGVDHVRVNGQGFIIGLPRLLDLTVFSEQIPYRNLDGRVLRLNGQGETEFRQSRAHITLGFEERSKSPVGAGNHSVQCRQALQSADGGQNPQPFPEGLRQCGENGVVGGAQPPGSVILLDRRVQFSLRPV